MIAKIISHIGSNIFTVVTVIIVIAVLSMIIVAVMTIFANKKQAHSNINNIVLPPSADDSDDINDDDTTPSIKPSFPYHFGYGVNKFLIKNGYIRVHSIVKSFFKAQDFLRKVLGIGYRYKLPWYILVGEERSGKSSMMQTFALDEVIDDNQKNTALTWWFLKNGVVLDIHGKLFLPKESINANDHSWRLIFDLLVRYRAHRPINGILLTIPADELYGKTKRSLEDLKKRAQYAARKLSFAQNYIGMRLPVYVIITKSDVVSGFRSFAASIPQRNKLNMFGWSSSFGIDTLYTSQFFADAFDHFMDNVMELSLEIFAENNKAATRDGVLVFYRELSSIREYLQTYMDAIFKASSMDDSLILRGFYFIGDGITDIDFNIRNEVFLNGDTASAVDSNNVIDADAQSNKLYGRSIEHHNSDSLGKNILFFDDLLLKKIFIEDGIACATRSAIKSSNKMVLASKVATVLFCSVFSYELFKSIDSISKRKAFLYPSLLKVHELIKISQELNLNNIEKDGNDILSDCSSKLSEIMMQLNNLSFRSFFLPASWFASVNGNLNEALRISYQRVIVRTIYLNLLLKTKQMLNFTAKRRSTSVGDVLTMTENAEFANLRDYISGFIELEKYIKKFDSIRISGDPSDLNDLIDYTFAGNLTKDFLQNYKQFRSILRNTNFQAIDLSPYKKIAYETLVELLQQYVDTVLISSADNSAINQLISFMNNIVKNTKTPGELIEDIMLISDSLTSVCSVFAESGCWIDNVEFVPNAEFNVLLDDIEKLFGSDIAQQVMDTVAINFAHMRDTFVKFSKMYSDGGYDEKRDLPSSGICKIQKVLYDLCNEPFMIKAENEELEIDIPLCKMMFWDDNIIESAIEVSTSFKTFVSTKLKKFPKIMQEGLLLAVKEHYCSVIEGMIARAQSFVNAPSAATYELYCEELLSKQVEELSGCGHKFIRLMQCMKENSFVFSELSVVLNKMGYSLLQAVDTLFESKNIYRPSCTDLSDWNGKCGVMYKMFDLMGEDELSQYLENQRHTIKHIALDYAETITSFLSSKYIFDGAFCDAKLLSKWNKIVENVKLFESKRGQNSVSLTENFLQQTLNEYNVDNVATEIDLSSLHVRTNDYFLNNIIDIKRIVAKYALILSKELGIQKYNKLYKYYNAKLAGKYPFVALDTRIKNQPEASIEDVSEFFRIYEECGGSPDNILCHTRSTDNYDISNCYAFLQRIETFKMFFKHYIEGKIQKVSIVLETTFDGYDNVDKNVDNIVTRSIKSGYHNAIEEISLDKRCEWVYGSTIGYTIKLNVENGDPAPMTNSRDKDMIVDGDTVTFKCDGKWALLKFLTKYRADDVVHYYDDANRSTLAFKIPLNNGSYVVSHLGVLPILPSVDGDSTLQISVPLPLIAGKMPPMPKEVDTHNSIDNAVESGAAFAHNTGYKDLLNKKIRQATIGGDDAHGGHAIGDLREIVEQASDSNDVNQDVDDVGDGVEIIKEISG